MSRRELEEIGAEVISANGRRFLVSVEDYARVVAYGRKKSWYVRASGGKDRVMDNDGAGIGRFILGLGRGRGQKVFHINDDYLDARRCNLTTKRAEATLRKSKFSDGIW